MKHTDMIRRMASLVYDAAPFRIICDTGKYEIFPVEASMYYTYINISYIHDNLGKCNDIRVEIAPSPKYYSFRRILLYWINRNGMNKLYDAIDTAKKLTDKIYEQPELSNKVYSLNIATVSYTQYVVFRIMFVYSGLRTYTILASKSPFKQITYSSRYNREFINEILELVYKLIAEDLLYLYLYPKIYTV